MLAIIAAMEEEVGSFRRRGRWVRDDSLGMRAWRAAAAGERPKLLAVTGVGRRAAEEGVERLLTVKGVDVVLSVGFAGGLAPGARRGDLTVAERVRPWPTRPDTNTASDERLTALADSCCTHRRLPVSRGTWLTVESAVVTVEEKQRLARETGAVAAEMESYWLARAAAQAGVPFLGVRVVLDDARSEVPEMVMDWAGPASAVTIIGRLARNPLGLPALISLARDMALARRNLTRFLEAFVVAYAKLPEVTRAAARE
ncbi:MAG: hypothetical protein FJ315_00215 [SAR202 cluster bacterium]|nr:hypothetical protein [SAR202 cluster bacterium]